MQSETPTQIYPGIFSLYFGVFSSLVNIPPTPKRNQKIRGRGRCSFCIHQNGRNPITKKTQKNKGFLILQKKMQAKVFFS